MTRAEIALDRLRRHSGKVMDRMTRAVTHAAFVTNKIELDRLQRRLVIYAKRIAAEDANILEKIDANRRHRQNLRDKQARAERWRERERQQRSPERILGRGGQRW